MNYTRPKVEVVGLAVCVIDLAGGVLKVSGRLDFAFWAPDPAYDLDE